MTVSRAGHRWYASVLCKVTTDLPDRPHPSPGGARHRRRRPRRQIPRRPLPAPRPQRPRHALHHQPAPHPPRGETPRQSAAGVVADAEGAPPAARKPADLWPFGGRPRVRRAVHGGVKDLPSTIRDRDSSIRNNSDRTARVHEERNYSGRWVCATRSGGSIRDLRGCNLNDQTRSLKINRNDCG
ncbi:peptidase inhibitor family I36 protein [Streptomyces sp. NPDC006971]|uniref:peptidase inhibitor family I36 protein n=1 Tax=Streptomyces sp. NPDC006971 TaxID=3154784 RepID=UPI0033FE460C